MVWTTKTFTTYVVKEGRPTNNKIFLNQPHVFYLVIRLQSEDLKHLIPGTISPELQG